MTRHIARPVSSQMKIHQRKRAMLRFDSLEERTNPAMFNVQNPLSFTGLSNNGCVASADLNKDNYADVILTNFGTDYASGAGTTITVLYGRSDGGFNRVTMSTGGKNVSFVTVGDINNDGWLDVAAVNANQQNTGSVSIFMNDGAGNLSLLGSPFSTFGNNSSWVGLHEMTGDSNLDVVVCSFGKEVGDNITGNNLTIFQGNGNGTFASSPTTTLAPEIQFVPTALAIADFNGDGNRDIAAVVPGVPPDFGQPYPNGNIYVFRGTGSAGFAQPSLYETGGVLPVNVQAGDLNGDGKADLVIANAGDPNATTEFSNDGIGILLNVSSGDSVNFGVPNTLTANTYGTFAVTVADLNLDGKSDIAAVNYGSQFLTQEAFVSVYLGNGAGAFNPENPGFYETGTGLGGGQYLTTGDFDKNGTPDLVVAHATNKVGLLLNTSVAPATTSTNLVSSQNPSISGQSVTFTATVSTQVGSVTGGTVQFFNGAAPLGSPVALSGGQAAYSTSSLSISTHQISAVYSGASGFAGSTSNTVTQTVNSPGPIPNVTINQGPSQPDPTNAATITYNVHFSQMVTGFDPSDIVFSGTVGGSLSASISGDSPGQDYVVTVTGMSGAGTVIAGVKANAAINGTGVGNSASTSTDNTVTFDGIAPSVTLNQAATQNDPTNASPIRFTVNFSEPVTGFDANDVSLAGSTAGGTLVASVTGSGSTYTVSVDGMTTRGYVVANILANAAQDVVGNTSAASSSTDNSVEFFNTGVLSFSQVTYNATEGSTAQTATITVTRTGQTDGAVSITYNTVDDTAHSGGPSSEGQADYTPTSNILSWGDGESGSKTFTVSILPDSWNEGAEHIQLTLTNPVGSPGLGTTEATLVIAPSDGQGPGTYLDEDDDKFKFALNGRTGFMEFFRTDPDGDGKGPIELIRLYDTLPNPLKPKASLVVTVTKSRFTPSDGTVDIGAIEGTGLLSINARKANLTGDGINLGGFLNSLLIGNIENGADVRTLATANPLQMTTINALEIGDATTINAAAGIRRLVAKRIGAGDIIAPSIGVMSVTGQTKPFPIVGNMESNITVTGAGLAAGKMGLGTLIVAGSIPDNVTITAPSVGRMTVRKDVAATLNVTGDNVDVSMLALRSLVVVGNVTGGTINVMGNVGAVSVGGFNDSLFYAGYSGAPDGTGTFHIPATIRSFRSNFNGFANSRVVASIIQTATVGLLNPINDDKFGFYADQRFGSVSVINPSLFRYDSEISAPQGIGNFIVKVV